MIKKICTLIFTGFMVVGLCGCLAVMATLADTAKAKQTINVSYGDAMEIVKATLKSQNLKFLNADIRQDIAQVQALGDQDRTIRILVTRVSDTESMVAVRAGTTISGKEEAEKILAAIVEASK